MPAELRQEFLLDLSDRYTPEMYSLLHNNCNNFRRGMISICPCRYKDAFVSDRSLIYLHSWCCTKL